MGYCKDCKHWDNWQSQDCDVAESLPDGEAAPVNRLGYYGYANDDSGLGYGIRTGPMFGCIHFVQRIKEQ